MLNIFRRLFSRKRQCPDCGFVALSREFKRVKTGTLDVSPTKARNIGGYKSKRTLNKGKKMAMFNMDTSGTSGTSGASNDPTSRSYSAPDEGTSGEGTSGEGTSGTSGDSPQDWSGPSEAPNTNENEPNKDTSGTSGEGTSGTSGTSGDATVEAAAELSSSSTSGEGTSGEGTSGTSGDADAPNANENEPNKDDSGTSGEGTSGEGASDEGTSGDSTSSGTSGNH
jgi:hypothetical protein